MSYQSNILKHIIESIALFPLISIGIGGIFYYSFYEALGLTWLFSQGSVSVILLSSIPLFFKVLTGLVLACTFNFIFMKNEEFYFGAFIFSCAFFGVLLGRLILLGFNWENFFFIIASYAVVIFTFLIAQLFFLASDEVGSYRYLYLGILSLICLCIEPVVSYQGSEKADQLLSGSGLFSQVSFTPEGEKTIPTLLTITKGDKKYEEKIDWRILDMMGDKVIIIALNHHQVINGKRKQLVKIVEYKNISTIY